MDSNVTPTDHVEATKAADKPTYGQILRSSSILGGATALSYLIAMGRTKAVALLLGPAGIGMVSLFQSLVTLVGTVSGLGVASSGVREVAEAYGANDAERLAKISRTVIRLSWIIGLLGWILTAALSYPLAVWSLKSGEHALAVIILGASLVFTTVASVQLAVIQGMRRIGDLARLQVATMLVSTVIDIGLYAWLREKGIVPVLMVNAMLTFAGSWLVSSRVRHVEVTLTWQQTFKESRRLISFGVAFTWSAVLGAAVALATRSIITRELGVESNGIFQSAWGISGMFAGFILAAMGTDFYPRLSAASNDHALMNRLVNEQTEVGILLALPGLLGTMVFAPLVMKIFYSTKFLGGAELLPWFVLGVFFKIISWPLGFIQLAKGENRWFALSETVFGVCHLGLTIVLLKTSGLPGASHAFALAYAGYILGMLAISKTLSGFTWSRETVNLLVKAGLIVITAFFLQHFLNQPAALLAGILLCIISGIISLRGISQRLGNDHRVVRLMVRIPGSRLLFWRAI
ncbi:MAG: O-antigen translocase [Verrucomicrobiota bacterium]